VYTVLLPAGARCTFSNMFGVASLCTEAAILRAELNGTSSASKRGYFLK